MTHVFERVMLRCPYAAARRYVHDDAVRSVPPNASFMMQLEHSQDPLRFDERLRVHWTEFSGEIVLRAAPGADGAVLELTGDYIPPLATGTRSFDLFAGTKIASATARSVLRNMAEAIERRASIR